MGKMVRAVLFAMMAVFSTAVFAEEDPCAMPGSLTEIDGVYQIGSCGDLYKFAEMVNGGETGINGRLTADIDLNGSDSKQWTPIGTAEKPYKGTFDGDGHTISGLYFNDENVNYVGLFGFIGDKAKVQNVGVVDSYIRGAGRVGGVVGLNAGGTISNVYNTGAVSGDFEVGGVVGGNGGTVSNVYNTGTVSGNRTVSGVVGWNIYGTVSNVYNTGAVSGENWVGGVVGSNEGTVSSVYNIGIVSGGGFVGGVVGSNDGGSVENAYFSFAWGWCFGCDPDPIDGTKELLPEEFFEENIGRILDDRAGVWVAGYDSISNGWRKYAFPSLKGVGTAPTFIELDPNATEVEISNVEELLKFAELVNAGNTTLNAKLTADIVVNEGVLKADGTLNGDGSNFTQWIPIGTAEKPYKGIFDGMGAEGNAHVISGLYFNDRNVEYVGLFKYNEGMVQNVGVVDSYIKGGTSVGGVVGYNRRTVSNVYNTGAVSGGIWVGGVVGSNVGGIISNVYNTGAVSGGDNVGGVVGINVDGTVSNVYNTGAVSAGSDVGGVVGHNTYGTISDVYNTGAVSGGDNVGGVVGCNEGKDFSLVYISSVYYNTDFYTGNAIGKNGGSIENVEGKPTAELIAIDIGPDWVAGNLAYDKATGKLTASFPYLRNLADFQYKITALEFKVVDNVIQIANADDLKNFARLVSEFGVTDVDAELTADICLNACGEGESVLKADGTLNVADTSKFVKWTPIGTDANSFAGTFDGDGKTISGLYFNDETMELVGLFGMAEKATIKNVGVVDSYFSGSGAVGAVAGIVFDSEVSNVYSESVVSASDGFVGGIVGINDGEVTESYNKGSVSGRENVGGIVGINAGKVTSSYNAGTVSGEEIIGGIVGGNDGGTISNVLNMGSVIGTEDVGGIVGGTWNGSISDCYFDKTIYDGKAIGDNGGEEIDESDFGKTSDELVAGTSLKLDTAAWVVGGVGVGTTNDSLYYPYLKVFGPHKYVLGDVKKYAITVAVNDKAMGTVTGAGEYEYGTKVEISATAKKGYKFVKWSDGVKDAKRTITVTKAEKLTATFEKDGKKDAVVAMAQLPQFSVTASGKMVSIAGARPNTNVVVYDLQGNRVKSVVATSANFTFALPSAGVYIVKNGYTAKRVNVR